ncbi:MAG TPA: hypothetical protein VIL85_14315 [Thermomicrobiales bacterium]|jgi:predicted RNA-binding Zn-ribbon protein involved in translation (DUF1610 family)
MTGMFGATDELLVRGISAARDDDREQARFYLEWVLRDGPDAEQFVDAWYWLSRITADPDERRRCLAQVLGAQPLHAEARRGLAILDGRLDGDELLDPWAAVAPLTTGALVADRETGVFHCPKCGGVLTADTARRGLFCQFCGFQDQPPVRAAATMEQDWEAAIHTARGHRWLAPDALVLSCASCGATQALSPGQTSAICAFCGSAQVAEVATPEALIAPTAIAPFAFDAAEARERVRDWLATRQFRADDLDERARLVTPRPIYLPFWTFDIEGELRWQGFVEGGQGGRQAITGSDQVGYDDILVAGGDALPTETVTALRFDTTALVPYAPELLAGWPAELYTVPVAAASLLAREQVIECFRAWVRGPHDQAIDNLAVSSVGLAVVSYKLVLLPVWVTGYRYAGKDYRLVINGQSGTGHGEVPRGPVGRLLAWLTTDEGGR